MILASEEVITATLNVIHVISATTKDILDNEEVITTSLKVISAATKVILVTNNLMSAPRTLQ